MGQRAKKVLSDSLRPVDFRIGLLDSVLNMPDGQVKFFWEILITEELRTILLIKICGGICGGGGGAWG